MSMMRVFVMVILLGSCMALLLGWVFAMSQNNNLDERVEQNANAILLGDADEAWSYWSERCQQIGSYEQTAEAVEWISTTFPDAELVDASIQYNVDETQAFVSTTYSYPELNANIGSRWIRVDGEWYWDSC